MLPWDFGIINAIKKEIEYAIFPSTPPEEQRHKPYVIFELNDIRMGANLVSRVEFTMTFVDENDVSNTRYDMMRTISKMISKELTLSQSDLTIGTARLKVNAVENKKNSLILHFVGILKMVAIYEDE